MSKHLPVALDKTPTDFSTDTLLKQQQKSTIQWIGALPQTQPPGAPLPASALLRQLYANRESVIRANVHAGRGTTGSYYAGEMGPLPTPPGSEGSYSDQFVLHNQKSGDFGGLYSTPGGYTVDYHSAMTPPSSVSPRDKHQQVHNTFDNPSYTDVLRHQYNLPLAGDSPAQPLPLKPQPYPVHPTAIDYATSTLDQSQFYHHSAGFHLYHANKTNASAPVYPETLKNSNWYSTPS
jgi:neuronal PAS domain-containing protein 1/3